MSPVLLIVLPSTCMAVSSVCKPVSLDPQSQHMRERRKEGKKGKETLTFTPRKYNLCRSRCKRSTRKPPRKSLVSLFPRHHLLRHWRPLLLNIPSHLWPPEAMGARRVLFHPGHSDRSGRSARNHWRRVEQASWSRDNPRGRLNHRARARLVSLV